MKGTLSNVLLFAAGAAIGSAVTWKLVKDKYERIAQEEIDSVKETFAARKPIEPVEDEPETVEPRETISQKPDLYEYAKRLEGYRDQLTSEEVAAMDKPRVIRPDEYGDGDNELVSLNYYADGVLTDDWDNPIEDVEGTVGVESLTTFGKYEEDSVFVRNDKQKIDYEILRDSRNFADISANQEDIE